MMGSPLIPVAAMLLVFGVPYLVIYLQGRRLAAIETHLDKVLDKLNSLEGRGS